MRCISTLKKGEDKYQHGPNFDDRFGNIYNVLSNFLVFTTSPKQPSTSCFKFHHTCVILNDQLFANHVLLNQELWEIYATQAKPFSISRS